MSMTMTVHVDIPALDRFCDLIERGALPSIPEAIPEAKASPAEIPEPAPEPKEAPSEPQEAPSEPPKLEPVNAPTEPAAPTPAPTPEATVTLGAVQKAAAELRDQGLLKAVTGLFPEFGINKLSDLKGAKLAEFAGRLRQMGAKI